ncbi:MAG: SPOR domain-containing protein [Micrococcales bacterium]
MDNGRGSDGDPTQFWFNLKTLKVEEGLKSAANYRVGPFATREEAAGALELLRKRSQAWALQDERED